MISSSHPLIECRVISQMPCWQMRTSLLHRGSLGAIWCRVKSNKWCYGARAQLLCDRSFNLHMHSLFLKQITSREPLQIEEREDEGNITQSHITKFLLTSHYLQPFMCSPRLRFLVHTIKISRWQYSPSRYTPSPSPWSVSSNCCCTYVD